MFGDIRTMTDEKGETFFVGKDVATALGYKNPSNAHIEIPMEVLERLVNGKYVEGSLHRDAWTGRLTFNAYNRQPRKRQRDLLVKKLPWGWVKESLQRIKVFGSFPKDMGTANILGELELHHRDAKSALIERELIEFC